MSLPFSMLKPAGTALSVLTCALVLSIAASAGDEDGAIVRSVDAHYNALQSLSATFAETYRGAGVERSETGELIMLKPGKMRWDYRTPTAKLFVTDGKLAYFYIPGERQARKAEVKNIDDLRSPLRFLLGKTHLGKELEQLTITRQGESHILEGIPKSMKDRVDRVTLTVNAQSQITRIVIDEADGSQTEFQFQNIREDISTNDALFRFTPPAGVEVIDSSELTP